MDQRFFQLTGTDVQKYSWIIPPDAMIAVGELVVVTDENPGIRYFARVTGIGHDVQSGGFLVHALPIGCTGPDGIFRKPRTMPPLHSPVRSLDTKETLLLRRFMGELEVGYLMSGNQQITTLPVGIPAQALNQHLGIFATTGMGKSNLMKVFCASAINTRKSGILLTDPHGEYATGEPGSPSSRGLVHHPLAPEGLSVFTIRDARIADEYGMKPLQICYNDLSIADLGLVFDLTQSEYEVVNLLLPFQTSDIIDFFVNEQVESLPSHLRTTAYIGNQQDIAQRIRSGSPDALRLVQRQVRTLLDLTSGFVHEKNSSLPEILAALDANKVVLIDIPGISDAAELFILSAISRAVFKEKQHRFIGQGSTGNQGTVLICIEEAQRVLSQRSEKTGIFREIAMEGRKFGLGIGVITQQPKNIDQRVLAQMNTLFVMGLADRQDREIIASSAKHDLRVLDTEIQTLDRGDVIISTIGIPFPVSCHIHHFEAYLDRLWESASGFT
ncbi:ATP-binding protein [Methanospirillum stamsii]|uniref:ATP-binding protein n=1 Tax=Methanospirillum stamsii TaxID=1277351 RepID=A0A2V2N4C0_9EURY|nr:ATP-binding protein [Methanospirillum stamsii]PWR70331.1 ATP-binding protein [Methanospirillum stamsii]